MARLTLGYKLVQAFFGTLALLLLDVKYRSDRRAKFLMSGSPFVKLGLWLAFNVVPFFLPNNVVLAYGYVARVGSVLFLVIQLILLVDFVLSINDRWITAGEDDERYYKWMLAVTIACYLGCIALIVALFIWFKPAGAGSCSFNVAVISMSIILFVAFTLLSISPAARVPSLFPSAVISVYCMYLAYGALQSEPHTEVCNGLGHEIDAASGSTLAVGMVVCLLSVIYSAFKAGSNTSTFTFDDDIDAPSTAMLEQGELTSAGMDGEALSQPTEQQMGRGGDTARAMDEFTPVSYNYSFFHLVFALASTYIAMLMTGWGEGSEEKNLLDIGWASVVMKLLTQWATGLLYTWTLVAHHVIHDRAF